MRLPSALLLLPFLVVFISNCKSASVNNYQKLSEWTKNISSAVSQNDLVQNTNVQKIKNEVKSIGVNLQNFAIDVVEQIINAPDSFEETSSSSSEEIISSTTTTEETTDATSTVTNTVTETTMVATSEENSDPTTMNPKFSKKRQKRSLSPVNASNNQQNFLPNEQIEEPQMRQITARQNDEHCKSHKDQQLERQHIEDLKDEVFKLQDLVLLLRDQQELIKLLQNHSSEANKKVTNKSLAKVLEHMNNNKDFTDINEVIKPRNQNLEQNQGPKESKATHEELEQINLDLKQAISSLNQTKQILALEHIKEARLETELIDQKKELTHLRLMVESMYKYSNKTFDHNEVVGLHQPKSLPALKNSANQSNFEKFPQNNDQARISGQNMDRRHHPQNTRASDSDFAVIAKLFNHVAKAEKKTDPDTADIQAKILELEDQLTNKKKEEETEKQMIILKKLLQQAENQNIQSKSLNTNSDSEMLKKLEIVFGNKPQSKTDDEERELKNLQAAINKLRPKEDSGFDLDGNQPKDEQEEFQLMLNKLISSQGGGNNPAQFGSAPSRLPQMTPQQIFELQKVMGQLGPSASVPGAGYPYSNNGPSNGYQFLDLNSGYVCTIEDGAKYNQNNQNINSPDTYGKGGGGYSSSQYPAGGSYGGNFGNSPQNYAPIFPNYPKPNYGSNNYNNFDGNVHGGTNYGYNAPPINSYSSQSSYNPYSSPIPLNSKPYGYQDSSSFNTKPYSSNYGNIGDKSQYSSSNYGNLIAPTNYGSPIEKNQYGSAPYSSSPDSGYSPAAEESKNQFFPAPQPNGYDKTPSYGGAVNNGPNPEKLPGYSQASAITPNNYQGQKVDDLKTQIYGLQNVVNSMNNPGYAQKPEDKQTMYNLEQQINDLKNVVTVLSQDGGYNQAASASYSPNSASAAAPPPSYEDKNKYESKTRRRRSLENNQVDEVDDDIQKVASLFKKYLPLSEEAPPKPEARSSSDDIQRNIDQLLKKQLGSQSPSYSTYGLGGNYQQPYEYEDNYHPIQKSPKKFDIFASIVLKIVDKLLAITPAVLKKIFNFAIEHFISGGGSGYSTGEYGGYGYNSDIQNMFKGFGIFGFLPMIALKIIDSLSMFVNVLRKNKFFRTFLMPASVLLIVAGSVVFLIWVLQSGDDESYLSYSKNYPPEAISYENNNYKQYNPNYRSAVVNSNNNQRGPQLNGYNNRPQNNFNNNYNYKQIQQKVAAPNPNYVYSRSYLENGRRI